MSKSEPTASDIARLQQASDWVQRLNESDEPALTHEWLQWCRCDRRNPVRDSNRCSACGMHFLSVPPGAATNPWHGPQVSRSLWAWQDG